MAKPDFRFDVSLPSLKVDEIRVSLLAALRKQAKEVKGEFDQTIATWNGGGPEFETRIGLSQGEGANLTIGMTGDELEIKKWFWLDRGTKVRHALMSPDWQSKTTPRVIKSGPGRGRVLVVSRKINRPGIEAREWSKMIKKSARGKFKQAMTEALSAGIAKARKR